MENDSGAIIILTVLIVSAFLLIVYKLIESFAGFSRNIRYIHMEMDRAEDYSEYRYWRRELRCRYLCLIPFVTERNVMWLYYRLYHRPKHAEKKRSDGLSQLLAPSVIGACICAVCLCGASWAWFTASTSTGTAKIQAAAYTVSVSEQQEKAPITETAGVFTIKFPSSGEYTILLKPTGNATAGYCTVNFESKDYYTVQLPSGELSFTVYASEKDSLTVTPEWGTCAVAGEDNTIADGGKIGTKPVSSTPLDTKEISNDPANSETVPETTIPTTEQTQSEPEETALDTVPTETSIIPETTE